MSKGKNKKSRQIETLFPEGARNLYFGLTEHNNNEWLLGRINLIVIKSENKETEYTGAITFGENVDKRVANDPFPLHVTVTHDGMIDFHVKYVTRIYNQDGNLSEEFHFKFQGKYGPDGDNNMVFSGTGGVPAPFCPISLPADDGENVVWTSKGPTDPNDCSK